jgi:hypothetical protein
VHGRVVDLVAELGEDDEDPGGAFVSELDVVTPDLDRVLPSLACLRSA